MFNKLFNLKDEELNKTIRNPTFDEKKTKKNSKFNLEVETSNLKNNEELMNGIPKRKKTALVPKKIDKYELLDENLNQLADFVLVENFFQQKGNELNLAIVILRLNNYEGISKNPEKSKNKNFAN